MGPARGRFEKNKKKNHSDRASRPAVAINEESNI